MARNLFKHQEEGVAWLLERDGAILADEMGLGKTTQAIVAANKRTEGGIVIVPASLKVNWAREITSIYPDATVHIGDSTGTYTYQYGSGSVWYVVNYDILARANVQEEAAYLMPTTLILDEAHYIKNKTTIRTKETLKLAGLAAHTYLLTGTPILNRPDELYALLEAIKHPLTYGQHAWYGYVKKFCAAHKKDFKRVQRDASGNILRDERGLPIYKRYSFLDTSGASNLDVLHEKIKPIYLRRTKDVLGDTLPAKIIDNVYVDLADEYKRQYATVWEDYKRYLQNIPEGEEKRHLGKLEMARHLVELQKLNQVTSAGKIPHTVERVLAAVENGEKVIVFTQYKKTLADIKAALKTAKIRAVSISGDNNSKERQKAVDAFMDDPKVTVFVGNIQAAGVGINLYAASTVIFNDMVYTPALHSQAEDRAHRIGQKRQVNVYYMIAEHTVDENTVEALGKKQQIVDAILEGAEYEDTDVTQQIISNLLTK